jgi:hypothetical protein
MSPSGGDSEIVNEARVTDLMDRFTRAFRAAVPQVFVEYGEQQAQAFVDELKFKITSQLFGHRPLSRDYYLFKLKNSLDPRILIATGDYLDGIMFERVDDTSGVVFRCGMARRMHATSELPLATLQRFLEDGTDRMPARPHWRPQAAVFRGRAREIGNGLRTLLAQRVKADMA